MGRVCGIVSGLCRRGAEAAGAGPKLSQRRGKRLCAAEREEFCADPQGPSAQLQDVRHLPLPDMGLRPRPEALWAETERGTSSRRAESRGGRLRSVRGEQPPSGADQRGLAMRISRRVWIPICLYVHMRLRARSLDLRPAQRGGDIWEAGSKSLGRPRGRGSRRCGRPGRAVTQAGGSSVGAYRRTAWQSCGTHPAGRLRLDPSASRVHGPPGSQAHRQSSRVAEYTVNLPVSCPNNRHHLRLTTSPTWRLEDLRPFPAFGILGYETLLQYSARPGEQGCAVHDQSVYQLSHSLGPL